MKIALAQILSDDSPARNLELVRRNAVEAKQAGAELIVFPEATMCAFGNDLRSVAEPVDGPWANAVRALAAEEEITIVLGMFAPGESGKVRNTMLITGAGIDAVYDKIHLYDAYGFKESDGVTPGSVPVQFPIGELQVGVSICYDVRFPELFIRYAENGAALTIVIASWASGPGKVDQWQLATRARAMDSTTYVIAVDQADPSSVRDDAPVGRPLGVGHSAVIAPNGEVVEELGEAPELRVVEIDTGALEDYRTALPVLSNAKLRG